MKKVLRQQKSSGYYGEKEAITEKKTQLRRVLKGELSKSKLSRIIAERRLEWLKENLTELKEKYKELSPEEQAHRIIFLEHMNITPEHSRVTRVSPNKIRIDSYNFCPYVEACRELGLETKEICEKVNLECFEKSVKEIHPGLIFYRNHQNTRPENSDYCEEYIELIES